MIAAMLSTISAAALGQFALFYWRAVVAGVATKPLSQRVQGAAGLPGGSVGPADFQAMLNLHELAPELTVERGGLWAVRAYYCVLEKLGRIVPALGGWTEREMTLCSRYVAVLVDQRLGRTLAFATELRSR